MRDFLKVIQDNVPRIEKLEALAKDFGVVGIAKVIVDSGNGPNGAAITEHEFTKLVQDHAIRNRREGETPAQAFTRCFMAKTDEGAALRRAHAIIKNFPQMMRIEPAQVGGAAATAVNDPKDALAQLQKLAEEQRRRSPTLTIEQAFARVYAAAENAQLVAQERQYNRPRATTIYPAA